MATEVKTDTELKTAGYTVNGVARYRQILSEYGEELYTKAISFASGEKAKDLPLEVTHEHVRAAAAAISRSFGVLKIGPWYITANILEYVFTAIAGAAGAYLDKGIGIAIFVVSVSIAILLIVVRLTKAK